MTNTLLSRGTIFLAALALTACPAGNKCTTNADCTGGKVCSVMSGTCVTGTSVGGGAGGGAMGGGSGGGAMGGGSGGGAMGGGSGGGNVAGAETCEMATLITAGTLSSTTVGATPDYDPGCTGGPTPGPDTVYKISVPAGQRLSATATPEAVTSGNQFDLALYLIESPASNCTNPDAGSMLTCLAAADDPQALETAETVSYVNSTSSAVEVFIVVDSYFDMMVNNADGGIGGSNEGNFTLVTSIGPPPGGDRCDTATTLSTTAPLLNQNLADYSDDYDGLGTDCRGSNSADVAYQVQVPAGQVLSLTVTPDATFDPTVSFSDSAAACGTTCINGVDRGGLGDPEMLSYKNDTGAAQTVFIVIDGYRGSIGTFGLAATLFTPPADDSCASPIALTVGTALTGQTIANYFNDYSTGMGCAFSSGADRTYSINVPDGQQVTLTATPTAMANPSLSLIDGSANCGVACVAGSASAATGAVERLSFTNRSGMAKDYLVVVDFTAFSTGTFDLLATVAPPPADDVCQAPTAVTAGTPLTGQTTLGYANEYQNGAGTVGCADTGTFGPDRVYQVSIPANQRGLVTVTPAPDAGYNPSISLVEGAAAVCAAMPRVCAAGASSAGTNEPESVSIYNATGSAKSYFAIVDSSSGGGDFSIGYSTAVPPTDDTCTTSTTVAAGTQAADFTGFMLDYRSGQGCVSTRGPDRVYRVSLPPNQTYTATATPTADAGFDPVISFVAGPAANCESSARTCRGSIDRSGGGQPETGSFTNNSGATQEVFVILSDWTTEATNRDFTLVSTVAAATPGESCATPLVATAGMLTSQTTLGASSDVVMAPGATGCALDGSGVDRVYSVTIPPAQTLTFTAVPAMREDLIINIIDAPAATCDSVSACAASADATFNGMNEVATLTNSTTAAKTVFVQVTGYGTVLNYSVNVQIQ